MRVIQQDKLLRGQVADIYVALTVYRALCSAPHSVGSFPAAPWGVTITILKMGQGGVEPEPPVQGHTFCKSHILTL